MPIFLNHSTTVPAEIPVRLIGQLGSTLGAYASIDLNDEGRAWLAVHSAEEADALIRAAEKAKRLLAGADLDHAIAADLERDGEALGDRIAADEGIEPKADPVPWPTGFCGHQVPPGAWAAGFHHCRDDIAAEQRPRFDEAAAPNLSVVDDEDGEQR